MHPTTWDWLRGALGCGSGGSAGAKKEPPQQHAQQQQRPTHLVTSKLVFTRRPLHLSAAMSYASAACSSTSYPPGRNGGKMVGKGEIVGGKQEKNVRQQQSQAG